MFQSQTKTITQEQAAIDAAEKLQLDLKEIDFSKYHYGEYVKARYEKVKDAVRK